MTATPTKPEEIEFYELVRNAQAIRREFGTIYPNVRTVINGPMAHVPHKRLWRWLEKWDDRGWYEYGVALDLGWITPEAPEKIG